MHFISSLDLYFSGYNLMINYMFQKLLKLYFKILAGLRETCLILQLNSNKESFIPTILGGFYEPFF